MEIADMYTFIRSNSKDQSRHILFYKLEYES